ncbi:MAG: GatB/YqeY domain-containing protein [Candidatus Nanopelagicales bacterium]
MTDSALKTQLHSDLTAAMKDRDQLRSGTIRMALTAITNEEVAGKSSRELTDADVITVLTKEAKKRREAATAYDEANRADLADKERAELGVLEAYLPAQLSDDELTEIVVAAVSESGVSGPQGMGAVMKLVQPKVAGRADGGRIAAEVKRQLTS